MKNNDAIKLFLDKEGKELRGKHGFNFGVLVFIFLLAIGSIGFGSASMKYLQYKMDDPFINWVDIIVRQKIADRNLKMPLEKFLNDSTLRENIQFELPEPNYLLNIDFRHQKKNKNVQLQGRSIDSHSSILPKILDKSNVVKQRALSLSDHELGLIVTQGTLNDLGYTEIPAFIYLSLSYDEESCQRIGLSDGVNGSYPVAFPVVAVVRQLPGMNSFLFTKRFLQDSSAKNKTSFDITDEENNQLLKIVGEEDVIDANASFLQQNGYSITKQQYRLAGDNLFELTIEADINTLETDLPTTYNRLFNQLKSQHADITRIYDFQPIQLYSLDDPAYYSVQISNLAKIKLFQEELYDKCGIKLEMTSIDQKNNFQFVQRMGNILSVCIILIAVLFICFFIYFMLSTHFQRIQRNLGTFKAFGISNSTLYYIYIILQLRITLISFVVAFTFSWLCNVAIDGLTQIEPGYSWINVWVWQNLLLLVLAIVAAILASYWVARVKLQHTPGDLIYNRNQD